MISSFLTGEFMFNIENNWDKIIYKENEKDYFKKLLCFLDEEYRSNTIFPPKEHIFNAFKYTDYENVKVVIIGQDPYHEVNQAHGLAFSVLEGNKYPPSLKNIFKELNSNYNTNYNFNCNLTEWAKQGVFLINNVLTVREHLANSHKNKGWEIFTTNIIKTLNKKETPIIFVLWGNDAKSKKQYITNPKHYILESAHPSPLSAYNGFFGCNHFKKINELLKLNNIEQIDWLKIGVIDN